ncbi:MAG: rhamnulokinase [Spirochaetaceae bacterium]|nr:rhamnulokinase [Spirochaetaceae bacterium]
MAQKTEACEYFLAIDIGASSGRHCVASRADGRFVLEEVYRFKHRVTERAGHLFIDTQNLFNEILNGMRRAKELGKSPRSVGIDTWAVDFALVDKDGGLCDDVYFYRDSRTCGISAECEDILPFSELYRQSGIQKLPFNSVYQLLALKKTAPRVLEAAESFLMLPDYLHFLLCGEKTNEWTNATSTALVSVETRDWNRPLIEKLGLPSRIFKPLSRAGSAAGVLKKEIADELGFSCEVILPATHDTASAFLASNCLAPPDGESATLVSGTWSLLGLELKTALVSDAAREAGFTNEGGFEGGYRFLKNISGLWVIQSLQKEYGLSFNEIENMARAADAFSSIVDINDISLLAPRSMAGALTALCEKSGQRPPTNDGEIFSLAYHSLARAYKNALADLSKASGTALSRILLCGGGCKDRYLTSLSAQEAGIPVVTGLNEASAAGNGIAQMLGAGVIASLDDAKTLLQNSYLENK